MIISIFNNLTFAMQNLLKQGVINHTSKNTQY